MDKSDQQCYENLKLRVWAWLMYIDFKIFHGKAIWDHRNHTDYII